MQYCCLHHWTLLPSLVTSTTGWCFCFGSISSFFLELFLHSSPVAYRAPNDLGSSSFYMNSTVELYAWTSLHGQYWNQIDYILCSQRWKSSIQSAKTRLEADCGSDNELLIAKFRLKLKKVGKTTRPFRYDLNQILYDYPVEVTNRLKGLEVIECLNNYGWRFMSLYRKQWSRYSLRKKMQKRQNGWLRRPYKQLWNEEKWKEKERYTHLNAEFQRIAGREKKAFLSDQCKEKWNGKD